MKRAYKTNKYLSWRDDHIEKYGVSVRFNDRSIAEVKKWHEDNEVADQWEATLWNLEMGFLTRQLKVDAETLRNAFANINALNTALKRIELYEVWLLTSADFYAQGEFKETGDSPLNTAGASVEYWKMIAKLSDLCEKATLMRKESLSFCPQSPYRPMACSLAHYMYFDLGIMPTTTATGPFGRLLEIVLRAVAPDYESDPKSIRKVAVKQVQMLVEKKTS